MNKEQIDYELEYIKDEQKRINDFTLFLIEEEQNDGYHTYDNE